jgi:hypothetical protein
MCKHKTYVWIQEQVRPSRESVIPLSTTAKYYYQRFEECHFQEGVLNINNRLVIPECYRNTIMQQLSNNAGHLAVERTLTQIKQRFHWIGIRDSVKAWVAKCVPCQRCTIGQHHSARLQIKIVGAPWERVAIDVLGPLNMTDEGNKYKIILRSGWKNLLCQTKRHPQ